MKIDELSELKLRAVYNGETCAVIRAASRDDAKRIEKLYRSVQFRPNLFGRLRLEGFSSKGGMFETPSADEIRQECTEENQCFTIAECGGRFVALMRLNDDSSKFKELAAKDSIYYVELVVRSKYPHLAYPFLLANFLTLSRAGRKELIFEIFHLLSSEIAGEASILKDDNIPSKRLHMKIGAEKIHELPVKSLMLGRTMLAIRPDVYRLELANAIPLLFSLCEKTSWRLTI